MANSGVVSRISTVVRTTENRAEWSLLRHNPHDPLADIRGAAGHTRAIAHAIRAGPRAGEPSERIEERIHTAEETGLPLTLWRELPPRRVGGTKYANGVPPVEFIGGRMYQNHGAPDRLYAGLMAAASERIP
jgi:hypothetical protein